MSHVDDGTLHAYLDGELSAADAQGVEAHLAQCPHCRARRDEEQALIARADELLGLAAPPDRAMPPFRVGDLEAPARLWWRLRLPLAWAATLILALAIGTYVGSERAVRQLTPGLARPEPTAGPGTTATTMPVLPAKAPERVQVASPRDQALRARAVLKRAAPAAGAPASVLAFDSLARAAAPQREVVIDGAPASPTTLSLPLDSARALLGEAPVALPGVPIRSIRLERGPAGTVVVVRQALDSTTVVELRERRMSELNLQAVVVTAQEGQEEARARPDSVTLRAAPAPAIQTRGAARNAYARLDSERVARSGALVARPDRPELRRGQLVIAIAGPLGADSLRKLLLQARPIER